jgi:hypothetical protein
MRLRVVLIAVFAMLALAATAGADPDPGGIVTDDPAEQHDPALGLDGSGISSVERYLGNQAPANPNSRKSRNVSLVGALQLSPFNQGVHGDVAGYKNLAFVGKWRGACPGTGVDIIDISNPAKPVKLADTSDYADTSMEDMQAFRVGSRDYLAVGMQDCGNDPTPGVGRSGLEIYDISNPANPQFVSFYNVDQFADVTGVHELDVATIPDGRTLAALSVPDLEAITSDANGFNGTGDLLLLDISNPANPTLLSEYGVLDDPAFGLNFYLSVRQGGDARTLLHSPRFNDAGTRLYLSYWDAGVIILDIANPANPTALGRTAYAAGQEGNAHSTADARNGTLLIQADEDFSPFHLEFNVTAPASIAGQYPAVEGTFTKPIVELPNKTMSGDVVHVGRGCPPGTPGLPAGDPYLADPSGKIALIERGVCRFDNKIAWAQQNGAIGAIVYNNAAGGEALVLMGGDNPVQQGSPQVIGTQVTIAGIFVRRSTGLAMINALSTSTVSINAKAVFDGWGYLRFFDISNPGSPTQVGTFATANTNNEAVATQGTWSVHNPEVRGSILYASWYSDGVRVIDFTKANAPKELGFWTGAGAPANAPAVNIWSVVPHGNLLLASDRNFGLYILQLKQP